jgi:hypothetical protein
MLDILQGLSGAELVGLVAILGASLVLSLLILVVGGNALYEKKLRAVLQRDMLARGLSLDEIERLTLSESERAARIRADQKLREARVAAELRRDLLASGLSIEEVLRLAPEGGPREDTRAQVLACTIIGMAADASLDEDALADLIELFLKRCESRKDAEALANAISHMAPPGTLDRDAVAGLLELALKGDSRLAPSLPAIDGVPVRLS